MYKTTQFIEDISGILLNIENLKIIIEIYRHSKIFKIGEVHESLKAIILFQGI